MILTANEALDIVYDDSEDWEVISNTRKTTDNDRWNIYKQCVAYHKLTGKFYMFDWREGATEIQDSPPFEGETEVKPVEVRPVEKTIEVWEPV